MPHMTKCHKNPKCGIFLKTGLFKDIKNDIPMHKGAQTKKYKIHKYSIWRSARNTQHMGCLSNRTYQPTRTYKNFFLFQTFNHT